MKSILTILASVAVSTSAFAEAGIYCRVEAFNLNTKSRLEVLPGSGRAPIDLGNGRNLDISLFSGDVRFTELRQASQKEKDAFKKEMGGSEVGMAGKIVGYSQVRSDSSITYAVFSTEDVKVTCSNSKSDIDTMEKESDESTAAARANGAE